MCLGVPMRIVSINGYSAECEARGASRTVSTFLLQHDDLSVGDLVMVHNGKALSKMSEDEARQAWEAYDEILELSVRRR